jgi:hypothetical protein
MATTAGAAAADLPVSSRADCGGFRVSTLLNALGRDWARGPDLGDEFSVNMRDFE